MLPRQGEMGENNILPEYVGKRSLNYLGTLERVTTKINKLNHEYLNLPNTFIQGKA